MFMYWTHEATIHFINLYKKEEVLYNNKHPLYHNKVARHNALAKLARLMQHLIPNANATIIKNKINILRTQFVRELGRLNDKQNEGHGDVQVRLWCFDKLLFLTDYVQKRETVANIKFDELNCPPTSTERLLESPSCDEPSVEYAEVCKVEEFHEYILPESSATSAQDDSDTSVNRSKKQKVSDPNESLSTFEGSVEREEKDVGHVQEKSDLSEWEIFGTFMAREIQNFRNPRKTKRKIIKFMLELQEKEEEEGQ